MPFDVGIYFSFILPGRSLQQYVLSQLMLKMKVAIIIPFYSDEEKNSHKLWNISQTTQQK